MRPIPVEFHIGPLQVHTYGIGLALTFWFGFAYFERRLRKNGYPTDWLVPVFLWIILAAVVGARAMHVVSNLSYYTQNPGDIFAIWHGGLSSFGGLLLAVPVGIVLTRRRCPELPMARALDLVTPVLLACWALGRLLGPQLWVDDGRLRAADPEMDEALGAAIESALAADASDRTATNIAFASDSRGAVGMKVLPVAAESHDRFQLLKAVVIIEKLGAPHKSGLGGLN